MKRALFAAGLVLAIIIAGVLVASPIGAEPPKMAGSVVKVVLKNGHGSGVHIGNGFILTAAHVIASKAEEPPAIWISMDDGREVNAEILWANKRYDVALLRVKEAQIATSPLACREMVFGEEITVSGNPGPADFVTTWGRVGSTEREYARWPRAVAIDVSIAPGNSGGPVFDQSGRVVGIVVATTAIQFRGPFPINYAVPAPAICDLLGRA